MSEITISTKYDGRPRKGKTKRCKNCGGDFWTPLHQFDKQKFCSRDCVAAYKSFANTTEVECADCRTKFRKKNSALENSKSGLYFCSRECKDNAQRIGGIAEIMPPHYGNGDADNLTKGELYKKFGSYGARGKISAHARDTYLRKYSEPICEICGYDFYGEVCHVVPVKEFNRDTLVAYINKINNLVYLCPNHHKELDKGKIPKSEIKKIINGR